MVKKTIQRRNISCFGFCVKGKIFHAYTCDYSLFPVYVKDLNKMHTTLPFETGSRSK